MDPRRSDLVTTLRSLERGLGFVSKQLSYLACVSAVVLTAFVLLSVFMRYFLGAPFHFTEDVVSLLFLATSFLSIPITAHRRSYIRISVVTQVLPKRIQDAVAVLASLVFLVFVLWFCRDAWAITSFSYEIGAQTETAEIPIAPWQLLMPIAMAVVALICIVQLIELFLVFSRGAPPDNSGETDRAA